MTINGSTVWKYAQLLINFTEIDKNNPRNLEIAQPLAYSIQKV